jgi:tetratricopeptide (TPR) repeat protein
MMSILRGLVVGALVLGLCGAVRAEGTFQDSIKAGDAAMNEKRSADAIAAFEKAKSEAGSNTDQAIALGKIGFVQAYHLKDYAAARKSVDAALALSDIHAVAKVTALQVKAECLMKSDNDFAAAATTLKEALALEGVDWAKPGLTLALGDAQRFGGDPDAALASFKSVLDLSNATDPIKAVAHLCTGQIQQYGKHDFEAARSAYAKAVELNPALREEVDQHTSKMK